MVAVMLPRYVIRIPIESFNIQSFAAQVVRCGNTYPNMAMIGDSIWLPLPRTALPMSQLIPARVFDDASEIFDTDTETMLKGGPDARFDLCRIPSTVLGLNPNKRLTLTELLSGSMVINKRK